MDKKVKPFTESTAALLADAFARYSAYDYCMRQLEGLEAENPGISTAEAFKRVKDRIAIRCHEAADDWQSIVAIVDPQRGTYSDEEFADSCRKAAKIRR